MEAIKAIIEKKEIELQKAMLTSDVSALDNLIDDQLIFTVPHGAVINKQMDLEAHRSGIQKLTKLSPISPLTIHSEENLAIVSVQMELAGSYQDQPFAGNFTYTRVWRKNTSGEWKVLAGHASMLNI